jgi:hypothetical protein
MELFKTVMATLQKIPKATDTPQFGEDGEWKNFRSFYVSATGAVKLEFKASQMFGIESVSGNIKEFDLKMRDLKVFKGSGANMIEQYSEEKTYNDRIQSLKDQISATPISQFTDKIPFL